MSPLFSARTRRSAFTMVEILIGMGIASAMFAAALSAGLGVLRSLYAADDYSHESNEQLRAMDYIARDIRGALTVNLPTGGQTIALTLPQYYSSYDAQGNPTSDPVDPSLAGSVPAYGNVAQPLQVTYSVNGQRLIREQTIQSSGATARLVVCENVNDFQLVFVPQTTAVQYSLSFQPRQRSASAALRAATTLSATIASRPIRFK